MKNWMLRVAIASMGGRDLVGQKTVRQLAIATKMIHADHRF
jgi:hypothetical protein